MRPALGGWQLQAERMSWPVIAGGVLILAGVAVAQWKPQ
jgi:drug/metabolite transporter (DMT)-like permease